MFNWMEIAESICRGLVEPYYKTPIWEYSNFAITRRNKRVKFALSQTHLAMGESAGKSRKRYLDRPLGISKIDLIHSPDHSFDEWSWENLVLSKLKASLQRITGIIPFQGK